MRCLFTLIRAFPEALPETGKTGYALRRTIENLKARAADLEEVLGYRPRTKLEEDDAAVAILEAAREGEGAALVAVGSRGLVAADLAWLESTSTKVVRAAHGPVLVYPHAR